MTLTDVNVLIYAHRAESPEHNAYATWLAEVANGVEPFGMSEAVLHGFVRIVTNSRVFPEPTPTETALSFVSQLRSRPNCIALRPGPRHWAIFEELCRVSKAKGKLVADAYHAALALEHGCEWITTDGDFARFSRLRWRHPLA